MSALHSNSCDVCLSTEPAAPVFHLGPPPFIEIRVGDCVTCQSENIPINLKDECDSCNTEGAKIADRYLKRGMISVLCDKHARFIPLYCVNGHRLVTGMYAEGTLLCYGCYTTTPNKCLGCGRMHNSKNKDLCPDCQIKVNNNICTKCSGDTYRDYVDNAGRCSKCTIK